MNKLIVRNLLWTLAIYVALTAILVAVVFLGGGYPLRVLVVMGILVPAMVAIVTFLTLQSGKNRGAGGGNVDYPERTNYPRRTNYSGPTYYPVWISEGGGEDSGGGGDFNVKEFGGGNFGDGDFSVEDFGGGDFGGGGDSGGGGFGGGDFGGGDFGGGDFGGGN